MISAIKTSQQGEQIRTDEGGHGVSLQEVTFEWKAE